MSVNFTCASGNLLPVTTLDAVTQALSKCFLVCKLNVVLYAKRMDFD